MIVRWIAIFILGFVLTSILPVEFLYTGRFVVDILVRAIMSLFFVFLIWLLAPRSK